MVALSAAPPVAAQVDSAVPRSLREGWGFADDIRDFGDSLDGGYELTERDVDCDGESEVLLERLVERGATGNRLYALFDHTRTGYRYLGEVGVIWSVIAYPEPGGCYLATYGKSSARRLTMSLSSVAGGRLELLGRFEMEVHDGADDDANALMSALRHGTIDEQRLRRLLEVSRMRPIEIDEYRPLPWTEASTIEEVIEDVEGHGRQVFERVLPEEVGQASADAWWSGVSARAARGWAGTVEAALTAGDLGRERPSWLPPPGSEGLEIVSSRVDEAVRINFGMGRPPVGIAVGVFDAEIAGAPGEPARPAEITWAAVIATTRLGEADGILRLFIGAGAEGEGRRLFRIERLSNLDHDRDPEVVLEEEASAGRVQWVLDLSRPGEVEERRLHAAARDRPVPR